MTNTIKKILIVGLLATPFVLTGCGQSDEPVKPSCTYINVNNIEQFFNLSVTYTQIEYDVGQLKWSCEAKSNRYIFSKYSDWAYEGSSIPLKFVIVLHDSSTDYDNSKTYQLVVNNNRDGVSVSKTQNYYTRDFSLKGWYVSEFEAYAFLRG